MSATWNEFVWFAAAALILWTAASVTALKTERFRLTLALAASGIVIYAAFIAIFWIGLQRPPLRTVGETRLWYSFFVILSGLITYARWRYRWILLAATVMAAVFITMNIAKPEIHDQSLMPALQSGWFIPHVTVYMFSYSILGCAFILAIAGLWKNTDMYLDTTDKLVYVGMAFLTFGMLSGALWAKEAWGNYWSWDPKETWAAATWGLYLTYIHYRLFKWNRNSKKFPYWILILAFVCLQMCWYGVNYLPSAQESMHAYSN